MSVAVEEELSRPAEPSRRPVVNISVITPKPEHFEAFMALQLAQQRRTRGQVQGLLGGRLFRSLDNRSVVLVAIFETLEDSQAWRQDERLLSHLARVQPLAERAASGTYETAYEVGAI
jgi:heme-degrading monooxygenase HmoA